MFFKKKKENNILQMLDKKGRITRYFFLIIGCFLIAFAFNVFFAPNNIVTGGISGISIVVRNITGIPSSIFILVSYIILLIISFMFLGREVTKYSVIGSILYPIFVYLTRNMANTIQFDVNNIDYCIWSINTWNRFRSYI